MAKKIYSQWYLKIDLTEDISLRYYFQFEDRPEFNEKWVLKSHNEKKYAVIDNNTLDLILKSHHKSLNNAKEIIARKITKTKYRKIILSDVYQPREVGIVTEKETKNENETDIKIFCENKNRIKDTSVIDFMSIVLEQNFEK